MYLDHYFVKGTILRKMKFLMQGKCKQQVLSILHTYLCAKNVWTQRGPNWKGNESCAKSGSRWLQLLEESKKRNNWESFLWKLLSSVARAELQTSHHCLVYTISKHINNSQVTTTASKGRQTSEIKVNQIHYHGGQLFRSLLIVTRADEVHNCHFMTTHWSFRSSRLRADMKILTKRSGINTCYNKW